MEVFAFHSSILIIVSAHREETHSKNTTLSMGFGSVTVKEDTLVIGGVYAGEVFKSVNRAFNVPDENDAFAGITELAVRNDGGVATTAKNGKIAPKNVNSEFTAGEKSFVISAGFIEPPSRQMTFVKFCV